MVLSPYDGLPGPVVASAWGTQLVLTGADDRAPGGVHPEVPPGRPDPGARRRLHRRQRRRPAPGDRMTATVDADEPDDDRPRRRRHDRPSRTPGPRPAAARRPRRRCSSGCWAPCGSVHARDAAPVATSVRTPASRATCRPTTRRPSRWPSWCATAATTRRCAPSPTTSSPASSSRPGRCTAGWCSGAWTRPARRPPMAWVGGEHAAAHAGPDGSMPGMATPAQLAELKAATGVEAERIFLRLMIAHHTGGVAMAQAAVARGAHPRGAHPGRRHRGGADLRDRTPAADARRPGPERPAGPAPCRPAGAG